MSSRPNMIENYIKTLQLAISLYSVSSVIIGIFYDIIIRRCKHKENACQDSY